MAVNKATAKIILEVACKGLYQDLTDASCHFKILHVTEQMLRNMQNTAKNIGEKITIKDVNQFLKEVQHPYYLERPYWFSLPIDTIVPGEVLYLNLCQEYVSFNLQIMCMAKCEFLVIKSSIPETIAESSILRFFDNAELTPHKHLYIKGMQVLINSTKAIVPTITFNYLNAYFMRDLYKYSIKNNIWNRYNELRDYVEKGMPSSYLNKLLSNFEKDGLSIFVVMKMLDTLKSN